MDDGKFIHFRPNTCRQAFSYIFGNRILDLIFRIFLKLDANFLIRISVPRAEGRNPKKSDARWVELGLIREGRLKGDENA